MKTFLPKTNKFVQFMSYHSLNKFNTKHDKSNNGNTS